MLRAVFDKRALCLLAALAVGGCAVKKIPGVMGNPKWGLDITWHGHSCFTIKDSLDRTVVIDPFDETVGNGWLDLLADALFITHKHFDHNHRRSVKSRLRELDVVDSTGTWTVAEGLQVTGLPSAHDKEGGEINGPNIAYLFVMGGLRCVHLGDVGTDVLTDFQQKMIGKVDILFIPVGGATTVGPREAKNIVDKIRPSVVFPMHYGNTRFYSFAPVDQFTALFPKEQVKLLDSASVRVRESDLTDTPVVYILRPTPKN